MMDVSISKVSNSGHCAELRRIAKERLGILVTNTLLGTGLNEALNRSALYYMENDEGLFYLVDEGGYWRLLYYASPEASFCFLPLGKPVVVEEVDANGCHEDYIRNLGERLTRNGWEFLAKNLQVSTKLERFESGILPLLNAARESMENAGMHIVDMPGSAIDEVASLWKTLLKPTDVSAEHMAFGGNGDWGVDCVLDAEGRVCGANRWEAQGRSLELRHTVTAPGFQRRGIAHALTLTALEHASQYGCSLAYTYIDERNTRSLALYRKSGFEVNGKQSVQFILGGEHDGPSAGDS